MSYETNAARHLSGLSEFDRFQIKMKIKNSAKAK